MSSLLKMAAAVGAAAVGWRLVKRAWLFREGAEAEPSPPPDRRPPVRAQSSPDPVDEAIAESFPASDPPSYAAGLERR